MAALTAARSNNTYFSLKYKRIATRRGPMRALVAVEHAMVIAAWNLLVNGDLYRDPGPNYYTARQPARTKARAISQLETPGYRVVLEPLTKTG
jgi:transposase